MTRLALALLATVARADPLPAADTATALCRVAAQPGSAAQPVQAIAPCAPTQAELDARYRTNATAFA